MIPPAPDLLLRAFETAAGREDGRGLPQGELDFARRIVVAGRALLVSEPCPQPAFRRAEALFGTPRSSGARLLALMLDSWSGLTPAATKFVERDGVRGRCSIRKSIAAIGAASLRRDGDAVLNESVFASCGFVFFGGLAVVRSTCRRG